MENPPYSIVKEFFTAKNIKHLYNTTRGAYPKISDDIFKELFEEELNFIMRTQCNNIYLSTMDMNNIFIEGFIRPKMDTVEITDTRFNRHAYDQHNLISADKFGLIQDLDIPNNMQETHPKMSQSKMTHKLGGLADSLKTDEYLKFDNY